MLQFGGSLGPFIAGAIFDSMGNYQLAFLISVLICIVAVVIMLPLKPIQIAHH